MTCPKCGSGKIRSRTVTTADSANNPISYSEYECEDCWWNWGNAENRLGMKQEIRNRGYGVTWVPDGTLKKLAKGEISQEDIKRLRDIQEAKEEKEKNPPVDPFGPGRLNPSPCAFPRWGGTTGTPIEYWYWS